MIILFESLSCRGEPAAAGARALLAPLALIQVLLVVAALGDLTRPGRRVRDGSRVIWAVVILFANLIGPIIYWPTLEDVFLRLVGRDASGRAA
jgi:hypothetical protein